LAYLSGSIGVEDTIRGLLVTVGRLVRRVDRERSRPALSRRAKNPLLRREEGNTLSSEWETHSQALLVGHVLAELRAEDIERSEAGAAHVIVAHADIICD
jgi:hypothetical protein